MNPHVLVEAEAHMSLVHVSVLQCLGCRAAGCMERQGVQQRVDVIHTSVVSDVGGLELFVHML